MPDLRRALAASADPALRALAAELAERPAVLDMTMADVFDLWMAAELAYDWSLEPERKQRLAALADRLAAAMKEHKP
jgi:hypothetical protein